MARKRWNNCDVPSIGVPIGLIEARIELATRVFPVSEPAVDVAHLKKVCHRGTECTEHAQEEVEITHLFFSVVSVPLWHIDFD